MDDRQQIVDAGTIERAAASAPGERSARGYTIVDIMVALAITGVIASVALPRMNGALEGFRLGGDARGIASAVALTRLQASANFSQARVYVDFATGGYHIDVWQKATNTWVAKTAIRYLGSSTEQFGFARLGAPPPNTQAAIAQAPTCVSNAGAAIVNTACIVFNSRGIPVDANGAPTGNDAIYMTDNSAVFGVTVSASSMVRLWRTGIVNPNWVQQ